jgi:multimeric flavodoxin WrbA
MKKVLIIKTSPRKGGNSDQLAEHFAKGAREAGHEVEEVTLADKEIHFCKGCLACVKTLRCVQKDDAVEICAKMREAEVIAWATPIYYYSISGQMKTMIDRGNPLYGDDYKFREVYLLATAAEDEPTTVAGARTALQGWVDCFEKATFKGEVFAGGVTMLQDISGHVGLQQAYELGKNV